MRDGVNGCGFDERHVRETWLEESLECCFEVNRGLRCRIAV